MVTHRIAQDAINAALGVLDESNDEYHFKTPWQDGALIPEYKDQFENMGLSLKIKGRITNDNPEKQDGYKMIVRKLPFQTRYAASTRSAWVKRETLGDAINDVLAATVANGYDYGHPVNTILAIGVYETTHRLHKVYDGVSFQNFTPILEDHQPLTTRNLRIIV